MNKYLKTVGRMLVKSLPFVYLGTVISLLMCGHAFADGGTNYLKGATDSVTQTFGNNSDFMKIIYIAEVCAIGIAWLKTKSPYVLLGLPVLLLVTHVFFGLASGT